jgi:hypothetical protein
MELFLLGMGFFWVWVWVGICSFQISSIRLYFPLLKVILILSSNLSKIFNGHWNCRPKKVNYTGSGNTLYLYYSILCRRTVQ